MYDRLIKLEAEADYNSWIRENNYSILSPRHRGYYAEMVFNRFCRKNGITSIKINPFFNILEQIPDYFLKKIQQKELKKLGKIKLDFFCFEENSGYFVALKMGTSSVNASQKMQIRELEKNRVFLFKVFEDGEILIKKLN